MNLKTPTCPLLVLKLRIGSSLSFCVAHCVAQCYLDPIHAMAGPTVVLVHARVRIFNCLTLLPNNVVLNITIFSCPAVSKQEVSTSGNLANRHTRERTAVKLGM